MIDSSAGRLLLLKDTGKLFEGRTESMGCPAAPVSTRVANFKENASTWKTRARR